MSLIVSDSLKQRRTWVVPLAFLGPAGLVLMGVIDFALRREWLMKQAEKVGGFRMVMDQLSMLEVAAITLGVGLLASMVFDVDHRSGGWKQIFALPVSRARVYLSKIAVVAGLMALASVLASGGIAGLWIWFGLGADTLPWAKLGLIALVPWIASFPLIGFQALVSAHVRNQTVSITLGVAGMVACIFGAKLPAWSPWRTPATSMEWITTGRGDLTSILGYSILVGSLLAIAGAISFSRRDVA